MAFYARRSLASRLSHHLSRRLQPSLPHLLSSHSHDDHSPPLPPPHFPSPLPQPPGTQTLNLLPFALHLAPRRSFSSSAPSPPGEVDAASVLTDAAEVAAAAAPAPFPGEVAAAAADSFLPVAALQHLMDGVHSFTGLNWWACIALTTVLIRSATLPLLINQMKSAAKLNAIRPEMEAIKEEMQNSMDPKSVQEKKKEMSALLNKHGVSLFTPIKGMFVQGPIFMSFFFAITNMVEKVPSLKGGGALWFTDLTTPDTLCILPVLTSLTFLATVEFNMQEGMEGNPMAGKMKNFSRGMAVMTVPFTMKFSKAFFCYWITSNVFSFIYGIVMRQPAIRKYLNLPVLVPQLTPAQQPTVNFIGGHKAIPAVDSPVSIKEMPRSTLEQPNAAALGYKIKNLEKKAKSRGKSRRRG